MTISKNFINHDGHIIPEIKGAGGGKGGGKISPNSLFSTDFLFLTTAIGEGPVYRINPNGPQDIQIQDSNIDDLINIDGDGKEDSTSFYTGIAYGTTTQPAMPNFGDSIVSPQSFASAITLKYGNVANIPKSSIEFQDTSAAAWDRLTFLFIVDQLGQSDDKGNINGYSLSVKITIRSANPSNYNSIESVTQISGKTDKPVKRDITVVIPDSIKSDAGYRFTIEKISGDSSDSKILDSISVLGWYEIEDTKQAYPRTAMIGYALKATNEHTGGIPTFTSMTKGLLVKVPTNYNQPILSGTDYIGRAGEIDWRQLELPETGINSYVSNGYYLQKSGTSLKQVIPNPQIYIGAWDGSFSYSWTQNPVWIIYDILTNQTYGLSIPERNIDKFKFYQIAQYCDACNPITGTFIGVDGLADGSYRYKPSGMLTTVRQNQVGLPNGTPIKERRFVSDISVTEQERGMDLLNKISATFRGMLIYANGKITLAVDMPNEYPDMIFNEATIKSGSFSISGTKESDIYTGVDVSYIDPTNHFKRETVRIDSADSNDGTEVSDIENIASIDLFGVTRRSQAVRMGQYHLAASKFQRRNVNFTTSIDAINLAPGDIISVSSQGTGIAYGFGGKVSSNSSIAANTDIFLENYTAPGIDSTLFTDAINPITLRVINQASDRLELYIISNTTYAISNASGVTDSAITVVATSKFNKATNVFDSISSFPANSAPKAGDLWSIGTIGSSNDYYTSKAGKLFKVTSTKREGSSEEISVSGVEYISNVYVDSDTFINYQPTSYTDIFSPFSTPPTPNFTLSAVPRRKLDGTIVVDGVISTTTNRQGYGQKFETEYYLATPSATTLLANVISTSPLKLSAVNTFGLSNGTTASITNKSGFSTSVGRIKLLCTAKTVSTDTITLTIAGLSSCIDLNYNQHVLAVLGTSSSIKRTNSITIPVKDKTDSIAAKNFVGYTSNLSEITRLVSSFNIAANTITILDTASESIGTLRSALITPPFYIYINQVLDSTNYSNNSFYIEGSSYTYIDSGDLLSSTSNRISMPVKPRNSSFVRFYVDGILEDSTGYILNTNNNLSLSANITYLASSNDSKYRVEVDYYSVPAIEIGDSLEIGYANTFIVSDSSFDVSSPTYSAALTNNYIYRISLITSPTFDVVGSRFINTSANPVGIINNVSSNSFTLDYDTTKYPGNFALTNNRIYSLELNSTYLRQFLTQENKILELPIGTTSIKARNVNTIGRTSPYVQQALLVGVIPIQKVTGLTITESIYTEQLAASAIRVTISFDHIYNQDVTDYEISYKMSFAPGTPTAATTGFITFNTVKVPASGVDAATGKISYSLNNINRGVGPGVNSIIVTITPLNKAIRGITATITQAIIGKTVKPQNVQNFIVGQQNDVLTFSWSYEQSGGQLVDLDLESVEIRKIPEIAAVTLANFNAGQPVVIVSSGSVRKSVPIESYGLFTYLAITKDTSGNYAEAPVASYITLVKPQRDSTVFAYSEDDSSDNFSSITNTNAGEYNFPSYSNVVTNGVKAINSTVADNANAASSGWAAIAGSPTNIKATSSASYTTQIRDLGQAITGTPRLAIVASQELQVTYNDQHSIIYNANSIVSSNAAILRSTNIGTLLGLSNVAAQGRYDSNNKSWMTGGADGIVWAVWNPGRSLSDTANSNSYALISGLINANAVALGYSYHANGKATGTNALANITTVLSSFQLVDLKQYNDYLTTTYAGDYGTVTAQTFIRTTTSNPYFANGNVNSSAFSSSANGYVPYEVGIKTFRYLQFKYLINNTKPNEYDFTLDKFRYTIDKEKTTYTNTVTYSSEPTTIDLSSAKFLYRPTINYTVLNQVDALTNPVIVVTTAASNSSVSFRLVTSTTGTPYAADSTANIMITAIGV